MTAKDLKITLLQEAVQGKLVPQIASEGNARDLLEEIRKSHTDLQIPTESAGKKKGDLRSKSQIRVTKKENRIEYIQSLASSQEKDDMQDFMDFMMNHHIQNLLQQINEYSESLDDDTLNYKNDTLNDTLKLSQKEITVLEIIKSNLTVTTAQIVEQTGFSRPTVMRAIKNLKENKILERVDSKKTGSWKVSV